jgi:hypothetical protein
MNLHQLKRPELLQLCRSRSLHNYSHLPKKDLIHLLSPPKPRIPSFASAILRHYYMYPILTATLFAVAKK